MSAVADPVSVRVSGPVAAPVRALSRRGTAVDPGWDEIAERAPQMVATMTAYLDQLAVSSRPATVDATSLALRQFADHLTASTTRACTCVAAIERRHVESFKLALAARSPADDGKLSTTTIRHRLGMLRTFFERIIDWDYPDAPRRVPMLHRRHPQGR